MTTWVGWLMRLGSVLGEGYKGRFWLLVLFSFPKSCGSVHKPDGLRAVTLMLEID